MYKTPSQFNNKTPAVSIRSRPSTATLIEETTTEEPVGNSLAYRLLVLAAGVYAVRFMLGLVRYILDLALCVLVVGGILAIVKPGPPQVAQALGHLERLVDPLYGGMAEKSLAVFCGPLRLVADQLGVGPGTNASSTKQKL